MTSHASQRAAVTRGPFRRLVGVFTASCIALGGAGAAWGDPITFNSAVTLSSGELIWREQFLFGQSGDDPSGAGREREIVALLSVLGYGIDENLSVFGVIPYANKRIDHPGSGGRVGRSARGLGDVRAFGRYTVLRRNWPRALLRVSPFAGLEAPTGDDDESDSMGRVPAAIQPGSGSWDPFGGIAVSYQSFDIQASGAFTYQANTEANDFEFGDVARLDAEIKYRVLPRRFAGGVPAFLYAGLEMNLIHQGRNRSGGDSDENSGGTSLFLAPALQYVSKRWVLESTVQLPVIQNLNGGALEEDFIMRAGFRFNL